MNRELALAAIAAYDQLSTGVRHGDQEAVSEARRLLQSWSEIDNENLVFAAQMAILRMSAGDLNDLLVGLGLAKVLAEEYLKYLEGERRGD